MNLSIEFTQGLRAGRYEWQPPAAAMVRAMRCFWFPRRPARMRIRWRARGGLVKTLSVLLDLTTDEQTIIWLLWAVGGDVLYSTLVVRSGLPESTVIDFLPVLARLGYVRRAGRYITLTEAGVKLAADIDASLPRPEDTPE
jgi:uncharacterized membrane protein